MKKRQTLSSIPLMIIKEVEEWPEECEEKLECE